MDESTRNDIIRMFYSRASHRRIAKRLGVDRKTVAKIIAEHQEARTGAPPKKRRPRKSLLDPFQDNILQLLERYPRSRRSGCWKNCAASDSRAPTRLFAITFAAYAAIRGNW